MIPSPTLVFAQVVLAQSQPPAPVTVGSVWDFVVKGGIVMIPIGVCSLVAIALAVERTVSLRRTRVIPPQFVRGLRAALGEGDVARGLEFCRATPCPIAHIAEAGLRKWTEPPERVEKHITQAGQREVHLLRKYLRGLSVIAAVSPLLGLLGTIFGMIKAFQTVAASAEALGRTELLAAGIYEAMITTAAGLIVAIPALMAYHYLAGKIDRLVFEMDAVCLELVERHGRPNPERIVAPVVTGGVTSEGPPLDRAMPAVALVGA